MHPATTIQNPAAKLLQICTAHMQTILRIRHCGLYRVLRCLEWGNLLASVLHQMITQSQVLLVQVKQVLLGFLPLTAHHLASSMSQMHQR